MIEFQKLGIGFDRKIIARSLDGIIEGGQLIALMGVNGIGKSCLLKTLTSINPPIEGKLMINGEDYSHYSSLEMSKLMAVVLTDKVQVDFLQVEELLKLGRSPHTNFWGKILKEDEIFIDEVINLLRLESIRNRYFSDLSDGQKQKALLARALVQGPSFLFLDEPTTYLDIPSKIELMKILKMITKDKGIGVLFSTHDLNLVEKTVDEIWLLDAEGVLHKKSPEEMHRSGLLKKNFNI